MNDEIGAAMAAAARAIGKNVTVEEELQLIVDTAAYSLPGFDAVGISTIDRRGGIETRAATHDLVWKLDQVQYELGEGPCVDSFGDALIVEAPRIKHDQRWPRYVPEAVAMGLQSQLAVKLYTDEDGTIGGLNIYSTTEADIHPDATGIADLFATHAALALGKVKEINHLHAALHSRELIGKAVGLVMARYQLDEGAAFAFLSRSSSLSNVKVRDIAARMIEEHTATIRSDR